MHRVARVTLVGRAVRLDDAQHERVLLVRRLGLRALAGAERQTVINRAGPGQAGTGTNASTTTTTANNASASTAAGRTRSRAGRVGSVEEGGPQGRGRSEVGDVPIS